MSCTVLNKSSYICPILLVSLESLFIVTPNGFSSYPLQYQQSPAPQNTSMEQPPSHLSLLGAAAPRPGTPTQSLPSWPGTTAYGQQIPAELIDQIEVLKQQLRVYADDFATEREDRERNQAEKEKLKEELDAVKEQLQTLEQQVRFMVNILLTSWVKNVQSHF